MRTMKYHKFILTFSDLSVENYFRNEGQNLENKGRQNSKISKHVNDKNSACRLKFLKLKKFTNLIDFWYQKMTEKQDFAIFDLQF